MCWEIGVAEPVLHRLDRNAKCVSRDLGHHCSDPGSELGGAGLDDDASVSVDASASVLLGHEERDRVSGCRHAMADQPVAVTAVPGLSVAIGPTERLRSSA